MHGYPGPPPRRRTCSDAGLARPPAAHSSQAGNHTRRDEITLLSDLPALSSPPSEPPDQPPSGSPTHAICRRPWGSTLASLVWGNNSPSSSDSTTYKDYPPHPTLKHLDAFLVYSRRAVVGCHLFPRATDEPFGYLKRLGLGRTPHPFQACRTALTGQGHAFAPAPLQRLQHYYA
jgi:hypothetical protein